MASPKRTKRQREFDLQEIASLYLQGWIQAKIADHIAANRPYKISQQIVSRDIKTIQQRWLESSLVDFNEARGRELAAIDHLETVAWEAYQLSIEPVTRLKQSKKVGNETVEVMQETAKGYGDPRFLDKVSWCIERRCRLLGLDAPVRKEISGPDGGPIETKQDKPDFSKLTDDELRAYISIAKKFDEPVPPPE